MSDKNRITVVSNGTKADIDIANGFVTVADVLAGLSQFAGKGIEYTVTLLSSDEPARSVTSEERVKANDTLIVSTKQENGADGASVITVVTSGGYRRIDVDGPTSIKSLFEGMMTVMQGKLDTSKFKFTVSRPGESVILRDDEVATHVVNPGETVIASTPQSNG